LIILRANQSSFGRAVNALTVPVENRGPLMTKLAADLERSVNRNFREGGRPIPWPRSRRVISGRGQKTLIHTAALLNSIRRRHTGDKATVFTADIRARIHEFGGTIFPREAGALTIPIDPAAENRSAKTFENTFLLKREGKAPLIMQRLSDGGVRPLYILLKSVRIPARPFMTPPEEDLLKMDQRVLDHISKVNP